MNIFILHENPLISAQMLCDKHIVKMPLETAQLLSNVFSTALKMPNPFVSITDQNIEVPYKLTHILVLYWQGNQKETSVG